MVRFGATDRETGVKIGLEMEYFYLDEAQTMLEAAMISKVQRGSW